MFTSPLPKIRVGIDIGCYRHAVAIGYANGDILDEFFIDHNAQGFDLFFERIDRLAQDHNESVAVAMEAYNGWARPLDQLIIPHGYRLFNVNNLKLARFKEIFPAAAKSDPVDSRQSLQLFQLHDALPCARNVLQEVIPVTETNEQLKCLTRRRKQLVDMRTRCLNSFRAALQAVCPGLLEITGEAANLWFLRFLTATDDLVKIKRMQRKSLLKIKGIGATYANRIQAWQSTALFSPQVSYQGDMILEDAQGFA